MFVQRTAFRWAASQSRQIARTSVAAAPFSTCIVCLQRELASPLQERDNVRNILSLSQHVRQKAARSDAAYKTDDAKALPSAPGSNNATASNSADGGDAHAKRPYARWRPRSWADVVHEQEDAHAQTTKPSGEMSEALRERLRTPKRMMDSYSSFPLPFRSDPEVLEQYINPTGGVRIGKLLEDLDSLAGDASYKHVLGRRPTASDHESNPIFIVTASVDRLDLLEPLQSDRNYRLNSMVIYVGSSSMEVLVTVEDISDVVKDDSPESAGRAVLTGRFTMATRNAATGKAQSIPPLRIENDAERELFAQGQSHKQRKKVEASTSLEKVPPTSDEAQLVHQLWLGEQQATHQANQQVITSNETSAAASALLHIEDTRLSSMSYMFPQQRNIHGKVFGGFLMRSAYELAFMSASIFARGKPVRFLSLDALSFHLPVSIGALLSLTSYVTYTSTTTVPTNDTSSGPVASSVASIVVLAELVDKTTGQRKKSNTFHFSFDLGHDATRVLPQSYRDSIAFIEGKRRVDHGNELRRISHTT